MIEDRRQHPRLIPDSALLVSLGRSRRGFLFDLSEGGLAFDGFLPHRLEQVIPLAFRLPDSSCTIEALGEVVWTNDSRHRTGVRFVKLADSARERLRKWISTRVFTIGEGTAETDDESASTERAAETNEFILQEPGDKKDGGLGFPSSVGAREIEDRGAVTGDLVVDDADGKEQESSKYRKTYSIGLALGVLALCSAFVALGYYLPQMVYGPKATVLESGAGISPRVSVTSVSEPLSVPRSLNDGLQEKDRFALQVGAMALKNNADALAEELRRKNFPAFVLERGADGLYRVDIGPYSDPYARTVKEELRNDGFKTVLERRLPK